MKEHFHFINTEGERFRFSTTPNLNRILLDAKNGPGDDEAIAVLVDIEAWLRVFHGGDDDTPCAPRPGAEVHVGSGVSR